MGEKVKAKCTWRFVFTDAKTGKVTKEFTLKNTLTTGAKQIFAQALANFGGGGSRYNWCIMLGTGTGTPSATDTGLFQAVTSTAKKGDISYSNNQVTYHVKYQPNEANGYTFTEAGIYEGIAKWIDFDPTTDYSLGTFVSHLLIDPPAVKDENNALDVYATITFV